jgi:recombination DNA repair RAD52 pathway protein
METKPTFMSKTAELYERLKNENKLTELTDSQIQQIEQHVSKEMSEFRTELSQKQAQSKADTAKIILSA